jgi:hypothetical protein
MRVQIIVYLLLLAILAGGATYLFIYYVVARDSPGLGYGGGMQRYVWVPVAAVPITFCVGLLAYLALFPEIKQESVAKPALPNELEPLAAIKRVLKDDERKVFELLASSGGRMLQRDISRQTGFSRVKTHRILYRLAARGIVTAEKHYNTYEITLAGWLFPKK